jgi:hypothetical protein
MALAERERENLKTMDDDAAAHMYKPPEYLRVCVYTSYNMDNLICHCLDVSQTRDDDDDDDVAPTQIYRHGAVSPNLVDSISRDGQKKRRK